MLLWGRRLLWSSVIHPQSIWHFSLSSDLWSPTQDCQREQLVITQLRAWAVRCRILLSILAELGAALLVQIPSQERPHDARLRDTGAPGWTEAWWYILWISFMALGNQCFKHSTQKENNIIQTSLIITFSPLGREVSQSSEYLVDKQTSRNQAGLCFIILFHSRGKHWDWQRENIWKKSQI